MTKKNLARLFLTGLLFLMFLNPIYLYSASTETVTVESIENRSKINDIQKLNRAGRNLRNSSQSKLVGLISTIIGSEILVFNNQYDSTSSNKYYVNFLGTVLVVGGIFSYFVISSGYEYIAAEDLLEIKSLIATEPLPEKITEKKILTKESIIEAIKKVKGVTVKEGIEIEKIVVTIDAKTLGFNETNTITSGGEKILNEVVNILKQHPEEKVLIEGHTDSFLAPEVATKLSEDRAKKVYDYYTKEKKLPEERFEVKGYGNTKPLVSNATEEGRAMNNRVATIFKREKEPTENQNISMPLFKSLNFLSTTPGVVVNRNMEEKTTRIIIPDEAIYFSFDSDNIQPEYYLLLDKIGSLIEIYFTEGKIDKIEICGHTDSIGDENYNINLSKRRADRVRKFFIEKKDFPEDKFAIIAYGKTRPVSDNLTSAGRAKNRRVEINLKKIIR